MPAPLGSAGNLPCTVGLCTEFGSRIQPGCDHRMEAGPQSCSCPSCHVVCTGKFKGCQEVWAHAVPLTLGSGPQARSLTTGNGAVIEAKNGTTPSDQMRPAPVDVASVSVVRSDEIQVLLAEVRTLTERVVEGSLNKSMDGAAQDIEAAAKTMLIRLETLPERIADAITNALARQHHMIMRDIRSTLREFERRVDSRLAENETGA
jgi:hypothetical protein